MNDIFSLILVNLEKIGIGAGLFLGAYLANMGLGAWNSIKINGDAFNWKLIGHSVVKFLVLILSLGLLSVVLSIVPAYATYIGIEIGAETLQTIDSLVIIGAFMTATVKYITDAVSKLKTILGG